MFVHSAYSWRWQNPLFRTKRLYNGAPRGDDHRKMTAPLLCTAARAWAHVIDMELRREIANDGEATKVSAIAIAIFLTSSPPRGLSPQLAALLLVPENKFLEQTTDSNGMVVKHAAKASSQVRKAIEVLSTLTVRPVTTTSVVKFSAFSALADKKYGPSTVD